MSEPVFAESAKSVGERSTRHIHTRLQEEEGHIRIGLGIIQCWTDADESGVQSRAVQRKRKEGRARQSFLPSFSVHGAIDLIGIGIGIAPSAKVGCKQDSLFPPIARSPSSSLRGCQASIDPSRTERASSTSLTQFRRSRSSYTYVLVKPDVDFVVQQPTNANVRVRARVNHNRHSERDREQGKTATAFTVRGRLLLKHTRQRDSVTTDGDREKNSLV